MALRYAICNELFENWAVDAVFRFAAETGYDAVELAPFTLAPSIYELSAERRQAIARSARAHGVEIAGLHWILVGPPGLHVSHPDPLVRGRTVSYLEALIRACADLGGKVLVFGSPKSRDVVAGMTYDQARKLALDTFGSCARAAEAAGVTFCLEPLAPDSTNFMTSAAEVVGLVEQIGSPGLRMILDVKSMCSEATSPPELIRTAAPYVAHFHANDANLRGPGFGSVDFVPIFRALAEVGYAGYVSVEVFDFKPDPETIARESLRYMREAEKAAAGSSGG